MVSPLFCHDESFLYTAAHLLAPCLQGTRPFWFFNSSPATRKNAVCLKSRRMYTISHHHEAKKMTRTIMLFEMGLIRIGKEVIWWNSCLKKFIILIFESSSISEVLSTAFCMWCNHLSAAWCVTGNGRWRPIRAGWPAKVKGKDGYQTRLLHVILHEQK